MAENLSILVNMAKKLTYKPGHTFIVRQLDEGTALISLKCPDLSDASLKGSETSDNIGLTVNNTIKLETIHSPLDAIQVFTQVIADFELHEAAEFLKYNGHRVFLPHGWDSKSNEAGKFGWNDFIHLNGRFLRALKHFIIKNDW